MKRSEAINKLKIILKSMETDCLCNLHIDGVANKLFDLFEKEIKMQPPLVRHQYNSNVTGSNNLCLETASVTYTSQWEPE